METTFNQSISYVQAPASSGLISRFFNWCKAQQPNRLLWLGIALAAHGCILTPITVMAVLLAGSNLFLFMAAIVAMGISLVTNLAAMPTKITIPAFVFSIVVDIAIIIAAITMGMNIENTYM